MKENVSALSNNLVLGLVERLPEPGAVWPVESRSQWIEAAGFIFALVYQSEKLPGPQLVLSPPITPAKVKAKVKAVPVAKAAPKKPGRSAGAMEEAILAALDGGDGMSVREVMAWLEKHRKELALSKSNLYSCV